MDDKKPSPQEQVKPGLLQELSMAPFQPDQRLVDEALGLIELDQSSYYLTTVPINLNLLQILALNLATAGIILLMLIVPSMVISRISPARAIRFE